jgi:hypothetical protein
VRKAVNSLAILNGLDQGYRLCLPLGTTSVSVSARLAALWYWHLKS